ncbi:hypothetical protein [Kitasatospora sp. CB02891]|uniref:DUF7848 domain-containing protein n=1 Tax=Kitasatospora sp. CB02891 TaxID=2020329 RepID=UPI000C27B184|nr:hypothetical protein [Kitasatospora sp. CB02891]PJN26167.1 hypothetical protein CG736_12340 [Kitasatospora sp. CB02891]
MAAKVRDARVLSGVLGRLVPDTGSDVESPTCTLICQGEPEDGARCAVASVEFNDLDAVHGWACVHMTRHPDHRSYLVIADVPMVLVPEVEPT